MAYKVEHRQDGWAVVDESIKIEGEPLCMVHQLATEDEAKARIIEYERSEAIQCRFEDFVDDLANELNMQPSDVEKEIKDGMI